ncbi:MAG TPA: glyoxylate/hydroxypyruvate reductase A [Burkholderiaceae bacterium]|nr:glyoxylate/hydroxypyruvate reductase A [Burkholderiaceae bacterium]
MPCVALLSEVLDMDYLASAFREVHPGIDVRAGDDLGAMDEIDLAVCWFPPHGRLAQMPNLRLVQSLAAGVDHILADTGLPRALPLCRIVDTGMSAGMKAYVCWAVVQQHRGMRAYVANSAAGRWQEQPVVAPGQYRVGIAGLGTLGQACAEALATIGYQVRGWSRSAKANLPAGVTAFHGPDQLDDFLSGCDTLVCLLPLTRETQGFLSAELFAKLPRGAHLINVGRGDHLVEADLLQALQQGQLSAATLDALSQEPLPPAHPFWKDPRILVTPHIATRTDRLVIAQQALANLAALQQGIRPVNQVDIDRGY